MSSSFQQEHGFRFVYRAVKLFIPPPQQYVLGKSDGLPVNIKYTLLYNRFNRGLYTPLYKESFPAKPCTVSRRAQVYSFVIPVYCIWVGYHMCVQPVQNTSPESTVLKDIILLYTATEEER